MRMFYGSTLSLLAVVGFLPAMVSPAVAEPLLPMRTMPVPFPVASGLAYANGSLWMTGPMGPGMTMLAKVDPQLGTASFSFFGATQLDAMTHNGTHIYSTRDMGSWTCGATNPNVVHKIDAANGTVLEVLPSPIAQSAGGLAWHQDLLFCAGDLDPDPCDGNPARAAVIGVDMGSGQTIYSFDVEALGNSPRELASDGTHLLYGSWSGEETGSVSNFEWLVHSLDATGEVVGSRPIFETQTTGIAEANSNFDIGGMTWGDGELFVFDRATHSIHVFAFPAFDPPSPPPPPATELALDIKPGDAGNSINLRSNGKTPAAILSTAEFNAGDLDPASIYLASAAVVMKHNGRWMASMEDVNGDDLADLVVHFNTQDFDLSADDTEATLVGATYDGDQIECTDVVRVVGERITRGRNPRLESLSSLGSAQPVGLTMISPNPTAGELRVSFTLGDATPARLEVVSVRGTRVVTEEVGFFGPGTHQFDLSSRERLAPGTYFVRLTQGSKTARSKVTVF